MNNVDHQHDSTTISFEAIKKFFIENLSDKWKHLARELDVNENEIERISRENISLKEKFSLVNFFF
jgi:plasmid maintenance system antidote protein VapI